MCSAHGKKLIYGDHIVDVTFDMADRRMSIARAVSLGVSDTAHAKDDSDSDVDDTGNGICVPIGVDDFAGYDDDTPIHSAKFCLFAWCLRRDVVPICNVNTADTVALHYMWNTYNNVMRRYSNIRTNSILPHIASASNSASVSLLYPEAQ